MLTIPGADPAEPPKLPGPGNPGTSGTEPERRRRREGRPRREHGLGAPAARTVTPEGDIVLLLPSACRAARALAHTRAEETPVVMELTDVAPVAVPQRIRGRAWVAGWLTPPRGAEHTRCARLLAAAHPEAPASGPGWTLARLEVGEARVDDLWGAEPVEPDDFAAALPDPLAPHETELLQHLATAHAPQLRRLGALLANRTTRADRATAARGDVVPLALDRYGLRLRAHQHGRCADARFDFRRPIDHLPELRREMRALFEAAGD
ncbi:DUF2470 domain-containing protein [Streptomyces sp. AJS327]|uniref:DUF2470 domain-containing protein n=1 Tax=Streptomyces sp. AJS327 TaxID=2545265 RepID=UPI002155BE7F|nr:DUF2470 domain-containing protein [Streptomyces sp. AJS327]